MHANAALDPMTIEQACSNDSFERPSFAHVLRDVTAQPSGFTGTLRLDPEHGFFFDHPLDHVPGSLLLAAVLQLVDIAGGERELYVSSLAASFTRFCELDRPVVIDASPLRRESSDAFSSRCHVRQSGECLGAARVELRRCSGAVTGALQPRALPPRVDPRLVHRSRLENVLLGAAPANPLTCEILPVGAAHFLAADRGASPLYLLEAARQFCTLLSHRALDVPLDSQLVLLDIQLCTQLAVKRCEGLSLRAERCCRDGGSGSPKLCFEVTISAAEAVVARVSLEARAFERATFERIRAKQRRSRTAPAAPRQPTRDEVAASRKSARNS